MVGAQQSDFFWSTAGLNSGAVNQPLFLDVEPGETGSLYLYYTSNGPSDSDINFGAILDIATSQPDIIKFTAVEAFDFPVLVTDVPIGSRWDFEFCKGVSVNTGTFTDFFIDGWGAFTFINGYGMEDRTSTDGVFVDQGYDSAAEAFLFGRVDFEVVGNAGCVQLQAGPGKLGVVRDGEMTIGELFEPIFGPALISVGLAFPGDVSNDGQTNLLDVAPFIQLLQNNEFSDAADANCDGVLSLLDVISFVAIITGEGLPVTDPSPDDSSPGGPLGDVNVDGMVNLVDLAFFSCLPVDCGNFLNADINQDGTADLLDICPMFKLLLSID